MSWYNSSWKYRIKITIDHAKVGSTLTDFPVYVDLSNLPSGFHTNVKSDGGDIRVTRSDGTTECPREIVFYDAANDKGELHFKANSLSSTTDTDFYIYYGNASASDYATDATYGAENVWDSNFKIVHHLKDSTTSSVLDSTSNSLDGTKISAGNPAETAGKIGRGQDFSGDHIALGDLAIGTTYTAEVWIKPDDLTGSGDTASYGFTVMASNDAYGSGYPLWITVLGTEVRLWAYESTAGKGGWRQTSGAGLSTGSWFHIQVIATKGGVSKVYVNGVERLSFTNDGEVNWCNVFTLGDLRPARNIRFDGQMDEVRVSNIIRSADYMGAEHTNQATPTTFYTVGTQEAGSTEANSIRRLYIQGKGSDNSVRGLYLEGASEPVEGWYNSNWKYRVKITVDHTKVGSDLTDFPVYVDLSTLPSGFHTNVKSDGGDIRVTRSDGTTECPREVVFYDSTNDKGELHFKANSLSSTTDTNFYIYYGNSSATEPASDATYGSENVWSAYEGVWHGNDTTTTTISDSTSNHYTGTKLSSENPLEVTGKIGKAQSYSSDRIDLGDVLDLGTNDASITQWIKATDTSSAAVHSFAKSRAASSAYRYSVRIATSGVAGFIFIGASGQIIYEGNVVVDDNSWHKVTVNFDRDGNGSVRVDGADAGSTSISTYSGQNFQSTMHTWIGAYPASNDTDIFSAFPGLIDETRIKFSLTSSDWDSAEYNNQSSPSTFYTVGTQEAGSTEANSIRGLYILGKNTGNSYRTLYIQGSQVLSTDYFNVVFSEPSISTFSERGLYLRGSLSSNSERGLLLEGKPVIDERGLYLLGYIHTSSTRDLYLSGIDTDKSERNFYIQGLLSSNGERDLYLSGYTYTSSTRDLYLGGIDTGTSERNLYTQGTSSSTSNRSFYIQGSISTNNERGLYLKVFGIGMSERGLYLTGSTSDNSNRSLYVCGGEQSFDERTLYMNVTSNGSSNRGLYIVGGYTDSSNRGLYMLVSGQGYDNRLLYLSGWSSSLSQRGLFLTGKYEELGERGLYLKSISSDYSGRGLYIHGSIGERSEKNLYTIGSSSGASSRGVYTIGSLSGISERSLYLSGIYSGFSETPLYIGGLDTDESERGLYLSAAIYGDSEVLMFIRGTWRPWVDKSVEYDTIYKDKGVVSGSSFNKTIINKTDTFSKRDTSEGSVWIDEKASVINNFTRKL